MNITRVHSECYTVDRARFQIVIAQIGNGKWRVTKHFRNMTRGDFHNMGREVHGDFASLSDALDYVTRNC